MADENNNLTPDEDNAQNLPDDAGDAQNVPDGAAGSDAHNTTPEEAAAADAAAEAAMAAFLDDGGDSNDDDDSTDTESAIDDLAAAMAAMNAEVDSTAAPEPAATTHAMPEQAAAPAPGQVIGNAAVPMEFPEFRRNEDPFKDDPTGLSMLGDVTLNVKIELGRTLMYVEDVLRLNEHSIVELDKAAGDPVDIYVNDRHVARGEVLVVNDNFCVRVSEIISPDALEEAS